MLVKLRRRVGSLPPGAITRVNVREAQSLIACGDADQVGCITETTTTQGGIRAVKPRNLGERHGPV